VIILPIFVVPIVIPAVVLSKCYNGKVNYQAYHEKRQN